jgi:hypothetical protein
MFKIKKIEMWIYASLQNAEDVRNARNSEMLGPAVSNSELFQLSVKY